MNDFGQYVYAFFRLLYHAILGIIGLAILLPILFICLTFIELAFGVVTLGWYHTLSIWIRGPVDIFGFICAIGCLVIAGEEHKKMHKKEKTQIDGFHHLHGGF